MQPQELKQANRELATILAALNLWMDASSTMRNRYLFVTTDEGTLRPLSLDETEQLKEKLNCGGYVSPSAGVCAPAKEQYFDKECCKLQLNFWVDKLRSLLNADTSGRPEDLEATLEAATQVMQRVKETAKEFLTYN